MKITTALTFLILSLGSVTANAAVTFDWATVGNSGNAPDTEVMNDGTTGYPREFAAPRSSSQSAGTNRKALANLRRSWKQKPLGKFADRVQIV